MKSCITMGGALLLLGATASNAATIIDLNSRDPNNGVTLSGYQTTDVLDVVAIDNAAGGGYVSWSAWSSTSCTATTAKAQVTPCSGWINNFSVWYDGDSNNSDTFASNYIYVSAQDALNGAPPVELTGYSSYKLFLADGNYGDNREGLSLSISVRPPAAEAPAPASLALLGLGLVGMSYQRRKQIKSA